VPHISLVFREMWDTRTFMFLAGREKTGRWSAVVSHISRKTSEIWGTHWTVARRKTRIQTISAVRTPAASKTGSFPHTLSRDQR
jgi:hypothetical protein